VLNASDTSQTDIKFVLVLNVLYFSSFLPNNSTTRLLRPKRFRKRSVKHFPEAKNKSQVIIERANRYKSMKDTAKTKDLYLASLWYAKHIKMIDIERVGKQCWFVFEEKHKCEEVQKKFMFREEIVNAKEYADAIKTLKGMIFSY
jgi:hypothetical protein